MLTDPQAGLRGLLESDRIRTLDLPQEGRLPAIAKSIKSAMKVETGVGVRRACAELLDAASEFYGVPDCGIRVRMRTAVRKEITSFGTFMSTLCHEFCPHLDYQKFGFHDSWHTRGFYERAAVLYHNARGTPPKKLFWVPVAGGRWRIDWPRTNRGA